MRRWLVLFLLALLPLQSSWAVVAAYCGHEPDARRVQHVGHHDPHEHAGQAAAGPVDGSTSADLPDGADCSHCHGSCASLPAMQGSLLAKAVAGCPARAPDGALRTLAQSPPERPQWPSLA